MRIGLRTHPGQEAQEAAAAEQHGAFGVLIEPSSDTSAVAAAAAAARTRLVRLIVRTRLGSDHPITLAEDLAVLDNLSGGRVVLLADTGDLDLEAAEEDLALLLAGLTPRAVRHEGPRWRVPAGLDGHEHVDTIEVTPKPVQVQVPVWLTGAAAAALAAGSDLPILATRPEEADARRPVQPAVAALSGELEADRELVGRWRDAGATHLLLGAPTTPDQLAVIARYLIPEVAMPHFPRVVAEAMTPAAWPGPARFVTPPEG
jgi:alkanesulfonate monooxygenase SsuD/methylene tetrahydromethanopterin reductase-like flavin-dependent oxidoreductase (luciferase family)